MRSMCFAAGNAALSLSGERGFSRLLAAAPPCIPSGATLISPPSICIYVCARYDMIRTLALEHC